MANATVSSFQIGLNWPSDYGTSGILKIISDREFVSGGIPFPSGRLSDPVNSNFCYQAAITVSGNVATVAAITLPQTDASGVTVINGSGQPTYTAIIYSNSGNTKRQNLFENWTLATSLTTSFNFDAWAISNAAATLVNTLSSDYYTRTQTDNAITARLNAPATTTQNGIGEVSVSPADSTHPIFVGDNDPRMRANASSYASLNAAVTAIGSTPTTLVISTAAYPSGNSCTVPATLQLQFVDAGTLTVANSQTIVILSDTILWPNRAIFVNALSGQGTISFSANKSITFLQVKWWGALIDGSTDDTSAWNATIAAGYTLKVATILMPNGISIVSSVSLPAYSSAGNEGISITIQGVGMPPIETGTFPGTLAATTRSSIIKSTTAGTAGVFTQAGTPFQAVSLTFKNCCIRREPNPTGPAIDGTNSFGLYLENALVDTGQYTTAVTQPTHAAAIGVIFPGVGNAASQTIRGDTFIQGYYTGILAGEHLVTDGNLTISACIVGMELPTSYHAMKFGRVSFYNNPTNIKISGNAYFNFQEMDIEHANGGGVPAWQNTTYDIDDSGNLGRGRIRVQITLGFVGVVSTFTKNGAYFVTIDEIRYEAQKDVFIRNSADLVIPDTTDTTLSFDTVDENLAYADLSNTSRIKPTQYGTVTLFANVTFAANATGVRTLEIWKHSSGTDFLIATSQVPNAGAAKATTMQLTAIATASDSADYFFVSVKQFSGGNLNVTATASPDFTSPRFIMRY